MFISRLSIWQYVVGQVAECTHRTTLPVFNAMAIGRKENRAPMRYMPALECFVHAYREIGCSSAETIGSPSDGNVGIQAWTAIMLLKGSDDSATHCESHCASACTNSSLEVALLSCTAFAQIRHLILVRSQDRSKLGGDKVIKVLARGSSQLRCSHKSFHWTSQRTA
jgi:hypothetical protein